MCRHEHVDVDSVAAGDPWSSGLPSGSPMRAANGLSGFVVAPIELGIRHGVCSWTERSSTSRVRTEATDVDVSACRGRRATSRSPAMMTNWSFRRS